MMVVMMKEGDSTDTVEISNLEAHDAAAGHWAVISSWKSEWQIAYSRG